mmetsp:Transcript_10417/g.28685  ORF Transcript_10417/g.28685 Transcript_10417/m.28685 type:complete len:215 (+) Transcript_10417:357-1001(+)
MAHEPASHRQRAETYCLLQAVQVRVHARFLVSDAARVAGLEVGAAVAADVLAAAECAHEHGSPSAVVQQARSQRRRLEVVVPLPLQVVVAAVAAAVVAAVPGHVHAPFVLRSRHAPAACLSVARVHVVVAAVAAVGPVAAPDVAVAPCVAASMVVEVHVTRCVPVLPHAGDQTTLGETKRSRAPQAVGFGQPTWTKSCRWLVRMHLPLLPRLPS